MKRWGKVLLVVLIVMLLASLAFNIFMAGYISKSNSQGNFLVYENANSRDTYFSIHNVKAAHEITKGEGIKVGILIVDLATRSAPICMREAKTSRETLRMSMRSNITAIG